MQQEHPDVMSPDQFPILDRMIYANHAAISPWPLVTAAAVKAFAEESCIDGFRAYSDWLVREDELRTLAANLLNAEAPDDIALLKNTTEGICFTANGIDWLPGDNVVIPSGEFPSNRMAWDALQHRGVEIREVDVRSAPDPEMALLNAMDHRTRVLTVSSVQWTDGFRLKLQPLGDACRGSQALFFVDAIQEFGVLEMDVRASGIDCLSAGSHKWQLGPEGIAVFYCSPRAREKLQLTHFGWRMVDQPYRYHRSETRPSASARRFEAGSPNMLGQAALSASLSLLDEVGIGNVERLVLNNSRRLHEGISAISGLRVHGSTETNRISGIVCFTSDSQSPGQVLGRLKRSGVEAAWRGDALRLSPHYYQHGAQIDDLLEALEQLSKNT